MWGSVKDEGMDLDIVIRAQRGDEEEDPGDDEATADEPAARHGRDSRPFAACRQSRLCVLAAMET